mmetsp:Transcript_87927/g.247021  ORF Transcript_87927/g.247021 Transcript_87927/m.247021 type:complete len:732 (-) Transcript_87927:28-2223(-)|eukprot:CAMPEP_0117523386 /NCGR_PEP_ID=MMETSP0784-20121206/34702_1 /TAXON_ID=39447 /ORGANISM="" /LENGTH=731 /DNA_ID=CAMNT_0005319499 /DNA_START=92 /DNA_END=2287 /DNA_ORIENTATION=-
MPEGNTPGNSVAALLPLALFVVPNLLSVFEGWLLPLLVCLVLVGGFLFFAHVSTLMEAAEKQQHQDGQHHQDPQSANRNTGELLELRSDCGLRLVAMKATWGIWPANSGDALSGETVALPVQRLVMALRGGDGAGVDLTGRVVVLRRSELRSFGVRSWLSVVQSVASLGPKGMLIVNVGEELATVSLPNGTTADLPAATLRASDGEALLKAITGKAAGDEGAGFVMLRSLGRADAALARADELTTGGRHAEAAEELAAGLQEVDGDSTLRLTLFVRRADALRLAGEGEEAVAAARAAVDLDPESSDGWVAVILAHRAAGDAHAAKTAAEQAIDLYELNDPRLLKLASELSRSSEEVAAEWKASGNELFKQHRFEDARKAYTAAIDALPMNVASELRATCLANRAACAQQLHDWDSVVSDATLALAFDPNNVKVLVRRARAYEAMELHAKALADARTVLRFDPRHPQANDIQHRAGRALREMGLPDPQATTSDTTTSEAQVPNKHAEAPATLSEEPSTEPPDAGTFESNSATSGASTTASSGTTSPPKFSSLQQVPSPEPYPAVDQRVHELEVALAVAAESKSALEKRCAHLEKELETLTAENMKLRAQPAPAPLVTPRSAAGARTSALSASPSRTPLTAARRAQQMEHLVSVLHGKARTMQDTSRRSTSRMSPPPIPTIASPGVSGVDSDLSSHRDEARRLHRELHKSRRKHENLKGHLHGFCERFQVRCM